jgi:FtsP/CotA-like multicopper oxidase with cupredoxin domain
LKYLFYILTLISTHQLWSQDQYIQLISKLDVYPQYGLSDGSEIRLMGYTEQLADSMKLPSPTIIVFEGDSVELNLWNFSQGAPHTIHLHGLDVDQQNDGVPHLSFDVEHSEKKSYYFKAPHPGTYLYHCHVASPIHVQAGMYGLVIVKPKDLYNITWQDGYKYDSEGSLLMSEIDTSWHTIDMIRNHYEGDSVTMTIPKYKPQYFLVNGKSESQLEQKSQVLKMYKNGKFYLRLANIGNYGNRVILPETLKGTIVSSDGRPLPKVELSNEIEILPGERYGVIIETEDSLLESISIEYFNLNTSIVIGNATVDVVVLNTLGIGSVIDVLNVYPNPAREMITVNLPLFSNSQIDLINIEGRVILNWENKSGSTQLDVDAVPAGMYYLRIKNEKLNILEKIIIE